MSERVTPRPTFAAATESRRRAGSALAAALLLALAASCGGGGAVLVQPAALWASPARYEGRLVRTTGVVRGFLLGTAEEHYVVEDATPHRVQLLGVAHDRLATMAGHTVVVVGRFHFSGDAGYRLDVQSIEVVG